MFLKQQPPHIFFTVSLVASIMFAAHAFAGAVPGISTWYVSNVGENSATLVGLVSPSGVDTEEWFEWGNSPETPLSNTTARTRHGTYSDSFRENISNLTPNTAYFFRAMAQNPNGTVSGDVQSFKTNKGGLNQITISTNTASSVNEFSAIVSCFFDPQGNTGIQRWVDWGRDTQVSNKTAQIYQSTAGQYSVVLGGLSQNTTYYFRCATASAHGNILNFRTDQTATTIVHSNSNTGSNTNNNFSPNTNIGTQIAITKPATNIIDTSAILNAAALPGNFLQTYGWFEWGSTPNLGYTSIKRYLGTATTLPFNEVISGLTPGTTYFFKPVIENQNGTAEGVIFSFHTTGMTPATTPISGSLNTASAITSIIKKEPKPVIVVPDNKKMIKVEVIPNTDTAFPNERISETVQIENTTNTTIKEVVVRVILPCTVEYISTGGDEFVETGKMLTHKIGNLKPNEKISLLLWMKVGADVADKTPMETIAVVNWEDKIHPNEAESVGRATVTVDKNKISKESAAVGAAKNTSSLFSENLKSWGAIIGFLFLLFAAYFVFSFARRKNLSDDEGGQYGVAAFQEVPATYPTLHATGVPFRKYNNDPFIMEKNIKTNETPNPIFPATQTITEKGAPPENLPI